MRFTRNSTRGRCGRRMRPQDQAYRRHQRLNVAGRRDQDDRRKIECSVLFQTDMTGAAMTKHTIVVMSRPTTHRGSKRRIRITMRSAPRRESEGGLRARKQRQEQRYLRCPSTPSADSAQLTHSGDRPSALALHRRFIRRHGRLRVNSIWRSGGGKIQNEGAWCGPDLGANAGPLGLGWPIAAGACDQANVAKNTVHRFEAGLRTPTPNNIAALRRAIEAMWIRLLFGEGIGGGWYRPSGGQDQSVG